MEPMAMLISMRKGMEAWSSVIQAVNFPLAPNGALPPISASPIHPIRGDFLIVECRTLLLFLDTRKAAFDKFLPGTGAQRKEVIGARTAPAAEIEKYRQRVAKGTHIVGHPVFYRVVGIRNGASGNIVGKDAVHFFIAVIPMLFEAHEANARRIDHVIYNVFGIQERHIGSPEFHPRFYLAAADRRAGFDNQRP